jgi:hypothetical protein
MISVLTFEHTIGSRIWRTEHNAHKVVWFRLRRGSSLPAH